MTRAKGLRTSWQRGNPCDHARATYDGHVIRHSQFVGCCNTAEFDGSLDKHESLASADRLLHGHAEDAFGLSYREDERANWGRVVLASAASREKNSIPFLTVDLGARSLRKSCSRPVVIVPTG